MLSDAGFPVIQVSAHKFMNDDTFSLINDLQTFDKLFHFNYTTQG